MLQCFCQSPDLSLNEMLWQDLKGPVDKRIPANLNEHRQRYKED